MHLHSTNATTVGLTLACYNPASSKCTGTTFRYSEFTAAGRGSKPTSLLPAGCGTNEHACWQTPHKCIRPTRRHLNATTKQPHAAVQGLPVSGWLSWGKRAYTLPITHPMLEYLKDGVLDISIEIKAAKAKAAFKPIPAFLHLKRGRELGPLRAVVMHDGTWQSAIGQVGDMVVEYPLWSPVAMRVDVAERRMPFQDGEREGGTGLYFDLVSPHFT
jgi:hypothetical protein